MTQITTLEQRRNHFLERLQSATTAEEFMAVIEELQLSKLQKLNLARRVINDLIDREITEELSERR